MPTITNVPAVAPKVGSEIDAYCTSCRTDKVHRIVAMVGPKPKKVECLSCKGNHLYRPTQAQKDAAAAHKRASKPNRPGSARPSRASMSPSSRAAAARQREEDQHATWEKSTTGKPAEAFKPYRIDKTFAKGDLVRHAKFGEGVVSVILDANKFEIVFKDGVKTLAQATQLS